MATVTAPVADRTAAVRAFNRSYTRTIGLLQDGLLDTPYTLTEARVLFELAQADTAEVVDVRGTLGLDAGYLSRILARFERDGLVRRARSEQDGRRQVVMLTDKGRDAYRMLDARSADEIGALLERLTEDEQARLVDAMHTIERILVPDPRPSGVVLGPPEPGDLGWVVERHGTLYAREYGWDASFEAFVVRIMQEYVDAGQAGADGVRDVRGPRHAAWIARAGGRRVGCIFCTPLDDEVAQLRLFLVEPSARGMGVGTRLVDECLQFARRAGYRRMTLWTYDVLAAARRIYQRAGFSLASQASEHRFGHDLVGQRWEREL